MPLKLDPRLPLVWRSPTSLQFGVDSPPVVLSDLSSAQERMIAALVSGVSRSGLSMIGASAGAMESQVVELLREVTPALAPAWVDDRRRVVTISGSGPSAERISEMLRASEITVETETDTADLAIIVAHYVIEPELHGLWLRRDIPHLAVVFGDTRVRVGPVIEPGSGACLHCLERWRTEADPAWPAIASQLWGRRSAAESALVSSEAAALAVRLATVRLNTVRLNGEGTGSEQVADQVVVPATSLHLDVATGELSRQSWLPHPDCGCLALPGNGSADAPPGRIRSPRRDAGAAVPV